MSDVILASSRGFISSLPRTRGVAMSSLEERLAALESRVHDLERRLIKDALTENTEQPDVPWEALINTWPWVDDAECQWVTARELRSTLHVEALPDWGVKRLGQALSRAAAGGYVVYENAAVRVRIELRPDRHGNVNHYRLGLDSKSPSE